MAFVYKKVAVVPRLVAAIVFLATASVEAQTTVYRSIGVNAGTLYSAGTASVAAGGTTVTFGGAACLPFNVGRGDTLTFTGAPAETLFILDRTSSTQVTLQTAAASAHTNQTFTITRAYTTLAGWETGQGGNLVGGNRVEVGVAYNDGPFTAGATILGNTTDATRYMKLTVADLDRHRGIAGTGVVLDGQDTDQGIRVQQDFTVVEWFEFKRNRDAVSAASVVVQQGGAPSPISGVVLQNLIIHDFKDHPAAACFPNCFSAGVRSQSGSTYTVRNSIVYDGETAGIRNNAATSTGTVENCTVHGMNGTGVLLTAGSLTVTNTVSMGNAVADFGGGPTQSRNLSSDATAAGAGSLINKMAANQFLSLTAGAEDFHLKAGADALDQGTALTTASDVDGDGRPGLTSAWDMGADEKGTVVYRSIGTNTGNIAAGTASVALGSQTVTFGAALPANLGTGDALNFTGAPAETRFILSRDSATQVTLQDAATSAHTNQTYTITRAFNDFQPWETARQGNLVTQNEIEVAVAYNDGPFVYNLGGPATTTPALRIFGSITSPHCFMRVTVAPGQRHTGVAGTGVVLDGTGNTKFGVRALDDFSVVEWLELKGFHGSGLGGAGGVSVGGAEIRLNGLLIHGFFDGVDTANGIKTEVPSSGKISTYTARNCVVYDGDQTGIRVDNCDSSVVVENSTVFNIRSSPAFGVRVVIGKMTVTNTISVGNTSFDFLDSASGMTQSHNLSSDGTASGAGSLINKSAANQFVNVNSGFEDLHLKGGADALDAALDLSSEFWDDIDGQSRLGLLWDIGADESGAPTEVELSSFEAAGYDAEVLLEWETASELENLGFHLYRAADPAGPYERITEMAIPGLGSSPSGAKYRYVDSRLANGVTYFYELEDIDARGVTTKHGPVSATPRAGAGQPPAPPDIELDSGSVITFGTPSNNHLEVQSWSRNGATVALTTEGFYATPNEDGTVRLAIPGFELASEAGTPTLPLNRPWIDAAAGGGARIVSIEELLVSSFGSLKPSVDVPEIEANRIGVVRPKHRSMGRSNGDRGLFPREAARILGAGFQGDVAKVQLEMAPLRWDAGASELRLARRLVVRIVFDGRAGHETSAEHRDRRRPGRDHGSVLTRLSTREAGLYAARYEDVFARHGGVFAADSLRLSRVGEAVAFHLEPDPNRFGPGSRLYFLSGGADENPYGQQAVYELELAPGGRVMDRSAEAPSRAGLPYAWARSENELNRYYQAGLLDAPDPWLWDALLSPITRSYLFRTAGLANTNEEGKLAVWLQGASDFEGYVDHHVALYLNGALVGEATWDGKTPRTIEADIAPGLLAEGENSLDVQNVGDSGASYSMVFLDRFSVDYPQRLDSRKGSFEGGFSADGTALVAGVGKPARVIDVTNEGSPVWVIPASSGGDGSVAFPVHAGKRYLAVSDANVRSPRISQPLHAGLRSSSNRKPEYLVIAPARFLPTVAPLLRLRREQGLTTRAVALEQIFDEFGFGEERPEAVRDFLAYVYHEWGGMKESGRLGGTGRGALAGAGPARLRYALLVGDATYDYKDYLATGVVNQLPPLLVRTSYLWTVSDPSLAMVNGDDLLPDFAIGRLPAADEIELRAMIDKILSYEAGASSLFSFPAVLVADNPDRAGDFVADAEGLASGPLAGREIQKIYLSSLGAPLARAAILQAFDNGPSLVSYMGHGGIALWADENVLNRDDVSGLSPQVQQPLLLTMNCLNGYFHFPYFNSLAEELLKAKGKGVLAAFSPSGLSFDGPAHRYQEALLRAISWGGKERLGDAVLKAQETYAASGAFPELLRIYHLLGDPALSLH